MATGINNPSSAHRDQPDRSSVHFESMGLLSHVRPHEAAIPSALSQALDEITRLRERVGIL